MTQSPLRTAGLVGATGLVGRELVRELLASDYAAVHAFVRSDPGDLGSDARLSVHVVDFEELVMPAPVDDFYCALGTTIKVAGNKPAFRRVDFDAVVDSARLALAEGASRCGVVSALGADANSRAFYNRVKGEMESEVTKLGFESVVFARPSVLTGDREVLGQPQRMGERIGIRVMSSLRSILPARVAPIEARVVARALVRGVGAARAGATVLDSAQMQSLGA